MMATPDQLPDVVFTEDTNLQFMSDSGVVVPASACQSSDESGGRYLDGLFPAVTAAYTVQGTLWPAAFSVSTLMMYANNAQLRRRPRAGCLPETLDELRTMSEKIKAANLPGVKAPLVMKLDPWCSRRCSPGRVSLIVNHGNGSRRARLGLRARQPQLRRGPGVDPGHGRRRAAHHHPLRRQHRRLPGVQPGNSSFIISGQRSITTVAAVMDVTQGVDIAGRPELGRPSEARHRSWVVPRPGGGRPLRVSGSAGYVVGGPTRTAAAGLHEVLQRPPQQQRWVLEGSYAPSEPNSARLARGAEGVHHDPGVDAGPPPSPRGSPSSTRTSRVARRPVRRVPGPAQPTARRGRRRRRGPTGADRGIRRHHRPPCAATALRSAAELPAEPGSPADGLARRVGEQASG